MRISRRANGFGRVLILLAVGIVGVPLFAGGGSEAEARAKKVRIRFLDEWGGGSYASPVFTPELEAWAEQHENAIEFVRELTSGDEVRTKIKVDMASGNTPEVFYYGGFESLLGGVASAGIALDVDKYFEKSTRTKRSDYPEEAFASLKVHDGKTYGIPRTAYMFFFAVNRELFQRFNLKYPKTYAEFLAVSKVFRDNEIIPLAMGSKGGNPSHFWFSELYNQLPDGQQEIMKLKESYKFDYPNAYRVARLIDEQRKLGIYPKDTIANGDWGPTFSLFNTGNAAMIFTFNLLGSFSEEMMKKVEFIHTPMLPDAAVDPATFYHTTPITGWIMSAKSWEDPAKQAAMVEFMDFLTSDSLIASLASVDVPPLRQLRTAEAQSTPFLKAITGINQGKKIYQVHFTQFPDANSFTYFQNTLDELFAGTVGPDEWVRMIQGNLDKAKAAKK